MQIVIPRVRRRRRNVHGHAATRRYFEVVRVRPRLSLLRRERIKHRYNYRASDYRGADGSFVRRERVDVRKWRELHANRGKNARVYRLRWFQYYDYYYNNYGYYYYYYDYGYGYVWRRFNQGDAGDCRRNHHGCVARLNDEKTPI